jgi:hypothetical protein
MRAAEMLRPHGYAVPTAAQRTNLCVSFAEAGCVLYGRAFDVVKCPAECDLNDRGSIAAHIAQILCAEIKSTNRAALGPEFDGYFFDLTNAELLVAQSLGTQFCFVFVNVITGAVKEMTLQQVFAKARKTYPKMAVSF